VTVASANRTTAELPVGRRAQLMAELPLTHIESAKLSITYELVGNPTDPLLVVAGGISAGRHVVASQCDASGGWWQSQSHALGSYRLLSINWIGANGQLDYPIYPSDQARAILAVLDALSIEAAAFVGASYGGMVGMHLAALAPHRLSSLLSISAAHHTHPYSSASRALQRQAIELGEQAGCPEAGVALARKLAVLTYRTPQEFAQRFERDVVVRENRATADSESYLNYMGERHSRRMTSVAYRRLSESIDLHQIDPTQIAVPSTFVAIKSDQLVPAADVERLANAAPNGRFLLIPSLYGHDAFLKEDRAIADILADFLNSPEQQQ
jgi:homoserine O-acetyltransferase